MKKNIYLYLFVFALLLAIFMFVNTKNVSETYERKIATLEQNEINNKKIIDSLGDQNFELLHFNLENNEDALSYLERDGHDVLRLIPIIRDELYKLNEAEGDHPLVPFASMTDNKMLINTVKLINHKWLIADFTDGKHWGEMLVKYEISPEKELKFSLVEYLMYPPNY